MKLAEALIQRADAQKRLAQLRERLARNTKVQEGEHPAENPRELLDEVERVIVELTALIKRINRTNVTALLADGQTLTDALADRDALMLERGVITQVIAGTAAPDFRFGRAEIKFLPTVDIAALQRRADDLARRHRELDTAIQRANWEIDLI